jgi:hypothetical protein
MNCIDHKILPNQAQIIQATTEAASSSVKHISVCPAAAHNLWEVL